MTGGQAVLDEFIDVRIEKKEEERRGEAVEEGFERVEVITEVEESRADVEEAGKSERMCVISDVKDPRHESRCLYCDEWVGRLHGGAIYLYTKYGRLYALADMDHVFDRCKNGLIENIRFLY